MEREVQKNLSQLMYQLQSLQSALAKKTVEIRPQRENIPMIPEMIQYTLLQLIPNSPIDKDNFKTILIALDKASRTSKEYDRALQDPYFKKIIVQKLFGIVTPEMLSSMKLPRTFSNNNTVLGTINNILYYYNVLSYPADALKVDRGIRYIVDTGIDPNFLITNQGTLLSVAIQYATSNTVKYLIQQGADVNLISRHWTPFCLALYYAPASALMLLESPNLDIKAVLEKLSDCTIQVGTPTLRFLYNSGKIYARIFDVLLDKEMSPNATIKWAVKQTPGVTIFNTMSALYPEALPLIEKMLKNGADQSKTFFDGRSQVTALQYAEYAMNNADSSRDREAYKKLHALLLKYKK